jgi:hypothetical protein
VISRRELNEIERKVLDAERCQCGGVLVELYTRQVRELLDYVAALEREVRDLATSVPSWSHVRCQDRVRELIA